MKTTALAPVLLALTLGGCLSFGGKVPPSLLTLTPTQPVAVGQTQIATSGTVTIATPAVPQEISTLRVPVRSTDTSVAYVKDAQWIEPPSRLFARLVSDAVTTRTGRVVIATRLMGEPGASLAGDLRSFGVDAATSSAVVTYDALLQRDGGKPVEKRRFEARVPVSPIDATTVGPAINQAANQVASDVADWIGR
ncbi:ABC transporter [Sphingomonas sp. Leaf33]|uniref:ABC-type transport auxiliary lipoprotein family protein n=1 Tax=Sphingomonas sp. Leaf33 TaxID=1736215 RepID=UPI0006FBDAE9|nr:ABC-type transport auxiliary lipoprotein family protein [Sphingomonas sp. Leaf33]KQN25522.1 ABC transporter [Sphingomonas sp. Leaf33]